MNSDAANAAASDISDAGHNAVAHVADLGRIDEIDSLFERVAKEFGRLDVLHNNVGMVGAPGMEVSEPEWDLAIDVNVRSAYYMTSRAIPLLLESRHASIVYTASIAALIGTPRSPVYSLAKGAVVSLMKTVAVRYADQRIRANAICPGSFDTPMLREGMSQSPKPQAHLDGVLAKVPMARMGLPHEFGELALFLASDASSFITGVAIPIDGGYTAA